MHVLGLTDMRESEMGRPFDSMGRRGTLVSVEPSSGVRGYLSALRESSATVQRRESDAVLVYNGSGLIGVVGMLLGLYHGIPLLIRLNGDILRQHKEKLLERARRREWASVARYLPFVLLTRLTFNYAHGFVPVSETLVEVVHRQTGCPAENVRPAPNPIRSDEYYVPTGERSEDKRSDDGHLLLTVTNLNFRGKYDGVVNLVEGLTPVLERRPDVEYVVAGDGRYHDRLRRHLDERLDGDLRERVRAPGFVDDVADLYAAADVFVYASYIDGYPNVILEAQAAGLPIVTNPVYGVAEQIADGETGVFVDTKDEQEVARTVTALLDDPAERASLGRNARERVKTRNSPDVIGRELHEAVRQIVRSPDSEEPPEPGERKPDSQGRTAGGQDQRPDRRGQSQTSAASAREKSAREGGR